MIKYVVNVSGYVDHSNNSSIKKTHYEGCKNLVSIFEDKNISKFVQIGSCIEYGRIKSPQKEIDTKYYKNTNSNYGNVKLLSSLYLQSKFLKRFSCNYIKTLFSYGPNQENNRVIPYVIENSISGKTFNCSPGIQLRDFLFVDDLMEAIYKCIRTPISNGQIINIGTGKPIRIKDLILKITKLSGGGNPVFSKFKLRKDEIMNLYPSVSLAKSKKWKQKIDILKGLKLTISHYKRNFK